jgi:hypothetical protein
MKKSICWVVGIVVIVFAGLFFSDKLQNSATASPTMSQEGDRFEVVTIEGEYSTFLQFPVRFFKESVVGPEAIVQVTDAQYLSLKNMHNSISPYAFTTIEYDPEVYGATTYIGIRLGDSAFPKLNNGNPRWEVMSHEQGHNFFGGTSVFYGTLAFPYPFLQESLAVLSAFYTYHDIIDNKIVQLNKETTNSLKYDFTNGRNYQKGQYELYVNGGSKFNIEDTLTSQVLDYKMIEYGEQYSWENYKKVTKSFEDGISDRFTFHLDGVSDIEQSTYIIASLGVAFDRDFRDDFRKLNFPIDNNLYSTVSKKIRDYIDENNLQEQIKKVCSGGKIISEECASLLEKQRKIEGNILDTNEAEITNPPTE